jgi:hypothetical protein
VISKPSASCGIERRISLIDKQRKERDMGDTIELLEAIGCNATLRRAPRQALAAALEGAKASQALTTAAASGDASYLSQEFGDIDLFPPQVTQGIAVQLFAVQL